MLWLMKTRMNHDEGFLAAHILVGLVFLLTFDMRALGTCVYELQVEQTACSCLLNLNTMLLRQFPLGGTSIGNSAVERRAGIFDLMSIRLETLDGVHHEQQ